MKKEIIIKYLDSLINFVTIIHYDEDNKSCTFRIHYDN